MSHTCSIYLNVLNTIPTVSKPTDQAVLEQAINSLDPFQKPNRGSITCGWQVEYPTRWLDPEKDLLSISKHFPGHRFELYVENPESSECWRTYVQSGKSYTAFPQLIWEPFDPNRLQPPKT